jgi:hypothetical protein
VSDMNWQKTEAFVMNRLLEEGDDKLTVIAERILHVLRVNLESGLVILGDDGSTLTPSPYTVGALETAKNLTLELALLWHAHPDFPDCWSGV